MSEPQQIANEKIASKSTGPKTDAGKARSRLNATKHGAYAMVCLDEEDSARFKVLRLDLVAEYNPLGFEEKLIVREIADTIWSKNRFKVAVVKLLDSYGFSESEGAKNGIVAEAVVQDSAAYGAIPGCLAMEDVLDRRLWRLFDRLRKLQKERGFVPEKSPGIAACLLPSPTEQVVPESQSSESTGNPAPT